MNKIEKNATFNLSWPILAFLLFSLYPPTFVYAQDSLTGSQSPDDALEEELRYLQAETYVITASRIPENIKKTAASITVVTSKQIREMGARNLIDVLETVPGWSNYYAINGFNMFDARGITNFMGSAILVMINSHSLNENWSGNALYTYDTVALDNVERIEFVRGPGSALYGANAFAGVINIITKEAEDIDGWALSTRGGSYDTQQYNLLYGKVHNDFEVVFNYNYFNTHGFNGHVNEDKRSTSSSLLERRASIAPERLRQDDENYDVSLNLKYKGLMFDGGYVNRERNLPFVNDGTLSTNSNLHLEDYYLNLGYERTLFEGLDIKGKVYRNFNKVDPWQMSWPPGATPLGPFISLDETIYAFTLKNKRTGFELQSTYTNGNSNTVVTGITYEEMKQYDVRSRAYLPSLLGTPHIILPREVDVTDIYNANRPVKRNFKAFFIEDIWDITDNLRFTGGVRYDDYSDFGSEVSPRIGLTWEFKKGYDLKLLYGHAFRAPSFLELYDPGFGNPDLDPEKIDTYQVSLGMQFASAFDGRITWFQNVIKDSIVLNTDPGSEYIGHQINRDKIRTEGLEVEMKYDLGRGSYLSMNYRYMIFLKRFAEERIPRHIGNLMANIRLNKYLNFYASCHIEDGFRRDRGDLRNDVSGYGIFNSTLIAKNFLAEFKGFELRGSVYNLFDKDYVSPAPINFMPEDMPRPGRTFIVEMSYKF